MLRHISSSLSAFRVMGLDFSITQTEKYVTFLPMGLEVEGFIYLFIFYFKILLEHGEEERVLLSTEQPSVGLRKTMA